MDVAMEGGRFCIELQARLAYLAAAVVRAAALVVDTGLHSRGWSRARAEQYLAQHTGLTSQQRARELSRYTAWPAQVIY